MVHGYDSHAHVFLPTWFCDAKSHPSNTMHLGIVARMRQVPFPSSFDVCRPHYQVFSFKTAALNHHPSAFAQHPPQDPVHDLGVRYVDKSNGDGRRRNVRIALDHVW